MKKLFFLAVFGLLFFLVAPAALAQTFSLVPATATKSAGLEFPVTLNIDTGGKAVSAADVKITFDPEILQITNVQDGDFFAETSHNVYTGTLYISGSFLQATDNKTGTGKMATLTLKGKAGGSGQFNFVCSTQSNDSNIFDTSASPKDIISCQAIKNGVYTITGSSSSRGSSSTPSGVLTPTPEPPVTGVSWPTIFSFAFGLALTVLGLVFIF